MLKKLREIVMSILENEDHHPYDNNSNFPAHPSNKEHKLSHAFMSGVLDGWYREQGTPEGLHNQFTDTENWLKTQNHKQTSAHVLGCDLSDKINNLVHPNESDDYEGNHKVLKFILGNKYNKEDEEYNDHMDAITHHAAKEMNIPKHIANHINDVAANY
jgi:hypothetical protein